MPLFPSFQKRIKPLEPGRTSVHDITSERSINFGASAPLACPQKTGIAHPSVTAGDATAAFNLNGKPVGVLPLFLDRAAAFDRGAGRLRGVQGFRSNSILARLSPNRCLAGRPLSPSC